MVTHSTKAASHAGRVLFIKDGELFHQIYREITPMSSSIRGFPIRSRCWRQAVMFMNRGFFPKLAADNIRKNGKVYFPYIVTCVVTVAIFYIVKSLS